MTFKRLASAIALAAMMLASTGKANGKLRDQSIRARSLNVQSG